MPFALQLQDSLRLRESRIADEFAAGDSLETVLGRHLLAVEGSAETELLTSILLLDETRNRLWHGAAPSLPKVYCEAINGIEIGPDAGSCGTAAHTGHAVYVTDVATDPLWKDYRALALPHGLRACWSTPIRDTKGDMIGTFAVYHLTPRSPTPDEVEAIRLITDHVAQAIMWSRSQQDGSRDTEVDQQMPRRGNLKLVSDEGSNENRGEDGEGVVGRFQVYAAQLDHYAGMVASRRISKALKALAEDCRRLVETVRKGHNHPRNGDMP